MLSLLDCLRADGSVDVGIYLVYLHQRRDRDRLIVDLLDAFAGGNVCSDHAPAAALAPCRRTPRMILARRDSEPSPLNLIPPEESHWYQLYVSNHYLLENQWLRAKFWLQFQLPYNNYKDLVEWVRVNLLFDRWCGYKIKNKKCSLVKLLVLG